MAETFSLKSPDQDAALLMNEQAFNRELPDLRQQFAGKWVAYYSGCLVAQAESEEALREQTAAMDILSSATLIRYVDGFLAG